MYRTICCELWTDDKIQDLSPSSKLLFLYLITNPHSHMSGIYYLPRVLMEHEVGLGRGIDGAWKGLLDSHLVEEYRPLSQVWVVNMLPYQAKGNKSEKGVASHLSTLHSSPLLERFLVKYPHITQWLSSDFIRCPIDTPSNPHTKVPSSVPVPDSSLSSPKSLSLSDKSILEKFNAIACQLKYPSSLNAADFQDLWLGKLRALGWSVDKEIPITLPDGRYGRIDLRVSYPASIAIEIDWKTPRTKSLAKLSQYPADYRIMILRECHQDASWKVPEGISGVIYCQPISENDDFDRLWDVYPRKVGKKAAQKAFQNARDRPRIDDLIASVQRQALSAQWTKDGGQFIPHLSTWLNRGQWADVPTVTRPSVFEEFLARGASHDESTGVFERVAVTDGATVGEDVSE